MTSRECFENKWFYMKYIGKYLSGEILLARECMFVIVSDYANTCDLLYCVLSLEGFI
jgi:hypothetical protein